MLRFLGSSDSKREWEAFRLVPEDVWWWGSESALKAFYRPVQYYRDLAYLSVDPVQLLLMMMMKLLLQRNHPCILSFIPPESVLSQSDFSGVKNKRHGICRPHGSPEKSGKVQNNLYISSVLFLFVFFIDKDISVVFKKTTAR